MTTADTTLTQGAVLVAGLAKRLGASTMARRLELTEAAVRAHATGVALPRAGARERYRQTFDVPLAAWEVAPGTPAAPTLPSAAPPPSPPGRSPSPKGRTAGGAAEAPGPTVPASAPVDALEIVVDLLRVARAQLGAAEQDSLAPYRERAQLVTACTGLCRLLARLSGQLEVSEIAIVRSQPWARAMSLVREVLQRHPAAAAELDAALTAFAEGGPK